MPTSISALPVLRGRDGAVLSIEENGVVLDLPHEQLTFTPDGLGRIRAEGGSVLVELRAKSGTPPRVHRVDDVDPAAAVAFADGVNEILALRTDSDDIDPTPFVLVRSLAPTWRSTFRRRMWRGVLAHLLVLVAVSVVAGVLGAWMVVLVTVVFGGLAWLGLWAGLFSLLHARRERWLSRYGVMTTATPAMNRGGGYVYPDATGTYRWLPRGGVGHAVTVFYPPEDPADGMVPSPPFHHLMDGILGIIMVFSGGVLLLGYPVLLMVFLSEG